MVAYLDGRGRDQRCEVIMSDCLHLRTVVRCYRRWDEYRTCLDCHDDVPKVIKREKKQ